MSGFLERSRHALRMLLRHKRFSALAIISLAMAIALNTTMYGVLDTMISPKLLIPDHEQLFGVPFYGNYRGVVPQQDVDDMLRTVPFAAGLTPLPFTPIGASCRRRHPLSSASPPRPPQSVRRGRTGREGAETDCVVLAPPNKVGQGRGTGYNGVRYRALDRSEAPCAPSSYRSTGATRSRSPRT